jgi:diguanylate cyclase
MDVLRLELQKAGVLGVLFLRLERWGDVDDLFTWRELDDAYQELSRLVSALLGKDLRRIDVAADLGLHGEGLAVILTGPRERPSLDLATVEAVAARLNDAIASRLGEALAPQLFERLTVEIGVAVIRMPEGEDTFEDAVLGGLVAAEEAACERQRERVRGVSKTLDAALSGDELRVLYQPVYDLSSGGVQGFETHLSGPPFMGLQHGDVLMDAAARSGLTHLVFDSYHAAALDRRASQLASHEFLMVRVASSELLESAVRVMSTLYGMEGASLSPTNVVFLLEATEVTRQLAAGLVAFRSVEEMGFRLALNLRSDCPPCLDHLRELRPDVLRISGRSVHGLAGRPDEYELLLMLTRFAARHRMKLFAAGCAQRAELLRLRKAGVPLVSGPYLAPAAREPVRADAPLL